MWLVKKGPQSSFWSKRKIDWFWSCPMFTVMHAHTLTFPKVHGHNLYFDLQTCRVGRRKSHIAHHQYPIGLNPLNLENSFEFGLPSIPHLTHPIRVSPISLWTKAYEFGIPRPVHVSTSKLNGCRPLLKDLLTQPPPHLWVDGGGQISDPQVFNPPLGIVIGPCHLGDTQRFVSKMLS